METRCEARLDVMGTIAHVIAMGDAGADLAERACALLRDLELRWSRFDPSSEISRLNANEGLPLVVSAPTVALIQLGVEAWRITDGRFDPTVLGDVARSGYDRTYRDITDETARAATSVLRRGCDDIEIDATSGSVRLPFDVGVDPGGIGKGLAADLAVDEMLARGAAGACVNVGGDLRVAGSSPAGGWVIDVNHPACDRPKETVRLVNGAIATSGIADRSWRRNGERRHHLIDPRTGEPIDNDVATVSVAAARGWQADLLTKAIFVAGVVSGLELAERLDAAALVVTSDGVRHANGRWCALIDGQP